MSAERASVPTAEPWTGEGLRTAGAWLGGAPPAPAPEASPQDQAEPPAPVGPFPAPRSFQCHTLSSGRRGAAGTTEGPPVAAITSNRASPSVPSSRNSPGKNTIRSASKKARHGWLQCPGVGPVQPVGCLESGPPRGSRVSATGLCQGHVRHLLLEM